MVQVIDDKKINETIASALVSTRRRSIICLHKPDETLQRMVNTALIDSYLRPHKHENPDKLEIFTILKGRIGVILFDDSGEIIESVILDRKGPNYVVEIPPKTWHNFVILTKSASLFEIIDGKYDEKTHKVFAPWSPDEKDAANAKKYLSVLRKKIMKRK